MQKITLSCPKLIKTTRETVAVKAFAFTLMKINIGTCFFSFFVGGTPNVLRFSENSFVVECYCKCELSTIINKIS